MLPGVSRPGSLGWMSRGACQRADPELFFPIAATGPALQQAEAAKAVCGRCAVRASCLAYALETMQDGIWGGTTSDERRARAGPARRGGVWPGLTGFSDLPGRSRSAPDAPRGRGQDQVTRMGRPAGAAAPATEEDR
jgi:WhiB family redox-sensing transcriptional regulator